jgi:chromosome segregation ATPase
MSSNWLSLILLLSVLFCSCERENYSQLKLENDSLRQQIEHRNDILIAMNEVNQMADSILNLGGSLSDTLTYQRYLDRIRFLQENLQISHEKIGEVSKELQNSKGESEAYNMMVFALQDEVSLRDNEISDHKKTLSSHARNYNGNLSKLEKVIAEKDEELRRLQVAIEEIRRMNAAESYFIKAQRLEEKGRRIIFAQRKRKESFREALELYHKAYQFGKPEAAERIEGLKKLL